MKSIKTRVFPVAIVLFGAIFIASCESGVPQEEHEKVVQELSDSKAKLSEANALIDSLKQVIERQEEAASIALEQAEAAAQKASSASAAPKQPTTTTSADKHAKRPRTDANRDDR
jgi:hypothetical protein